MTKEEKIEYYLNLARLSELDYKGYIAKVRELRKEKEKNNGSKQNYKIDSF